MCRENVQETRIKIAGNLWEKLLRIITKVIPGILHCSFNDKIIAKNLILFADFSIFRICEISSCENCTRAQASILVRMLFP